MGAPQYEQAGADIGGTGTTNTIPRWTGTSTLGDSVITQSGSNIGIGTASPNGQLQLSRSMASGNWLVLDDTRAGFGDWSFYKSTANDLTIGYDTTGGTSPSQAVTFAYGGNAGFGTASPVERLQVAGGIVSSAANAAAGSFNGAVMDYNAGAMRLVPSRSGANPGTIQFFYTTAAGAIMQGATLDSTGNVILNTANTGATIQAAGTQQGLKLPATPGNADTQTLDCYQENTWTPTVTFGTGGTVTPTITSATYTRFGRVVHFNLVITYTVTAAPTGGDVTFTLPVATSGATAFGGGYCSNLGAGNVVGQVFFLAGSATSTVSVYKQASVGVQSIATYVTANGTFYFSGTYQT